MDRYRVIRFTELDSTNRHVCGRLAGLLDGDVVQADVQTSGHGRMRRPWVSDVPGNLCMTLVIKPGGVPPALVNLSQLLALSVCRALAHHGVAATIKWPNDVMVDGLKIAGLLAESVAEGSRFLGMALGVGVNLNLGQADLARITQPATSLAELTGRPVVVDDFRDRVLEDFFGRCDELLETGFGMIRGEYTSRCAFLGTRVEIRNPGREVVGIARGIDPDGALEILTDHNEVVAVGIGEMFAAGDA